jgi:hypothetical protein
MLLVEGVRWEKEGFGGRGRVGWDVRFGNSNKGRVIRNICRIGGWVSGMEVLFDVSGFISFGDIFIKQYFAGMREVFEECNDGVVTVSFQDLCGKILEGVRWVRDGARISVVCWRGSRGISRGMRSVGHDIDVKSEKERERGISWRRGIAKESRERPPLWWEGRKKDESILLGNPKDMPWHWVMWHVT